MRYEGQVQSYAEEPGRRSDFFYPATLHSYPWLPGAPPEYRDNATFSLASEMALTTTDWQTGAVLPPSMTLGMSSIASTD